MVQTLRNTVAAQRDPAGISAASRLRAFTLVDVLVSLSVVALLVGLMLPVISEAQHAAWRVVCANNVRQVGLGLALYADDFQDRLPPSKAVNKPLIQGKTTRSASEYFNQNSPSETTRLRLGAFEVRNKKSYTRDGWDGIGILYGQDYIPVHGSFYCPAHKGEQTYDEYQDEWHAKYGVIRGNYQYRGQSSDGEQRLSMIEPETTSLLSDSLRQIDEWAHQGGVNLMTADLAVRWVQDVNDRLRMSVPLALNATAPLPAEFNTQVYDYPIEASWDLADLLIGRRGRHGH